MCSTAMFCDSLLIPSSTCLCAKPFGQLNCCFTTQQHLAIDSCCCCKNNLVALVSCASLQISIMLPKLSLQCFDLQIGYSLCCLFSLSCTALFILVLWDYYSDCQVSGIDGLCFYGDYFIFGTFDFNSKVCQLKRHES